MSNKIEYKHGHVFDNGVVYISENGTTDTGLRKCWFQCHCGRKFTTQMNNVKTGNTKSCGCLKIETTGARYRDTIKGNNYIIKGNIAKIELHCGRFAIIDIEDMEKCKQHTWCFDTFVRTSIKTRKGIKHLYLKDFLVEPPRSKQLKNDHKDGDRLNNRKENIHQTSELRRKPKEKIYRNKYEPGYKFDNGVIYLQEALEKTEQKGKRHCWFKCPFCENEFVSRPDRIKNGNTNSCGCYGKKRVSETHKGRRKGNEYTIEENLAKIHMPGGYTVLIDKEDIERCKEQTWNYTKGYARARTGNTRTYLHNYLMGPPPSPELEIDHIDGNTLNNQKYNLNFTTRNKNTQKGNHQPGKSGYRSVRYRAKKNHYQANIFYNYKEYHLGTYKNPIDAALAADFFAEHIYKEHAYLNRDHYPEIMEAYQSGKEDFKDQPSFQKRYQELIKNEINS